MDTQKLSNAAMKDHFQIEGKPSSVLFVYVDRIHTVKYWPSWGTVSGYLA